MVRLRAGDADAGANIEVDPAEGEGVSDPLSSGGDFETFERKVLIDLAQNSRRATVRLRALEQLRALENRKNRGDIPDEFPWI